MKTIFLNVLQPFTNITLRVKKAFCIKNNINPLLLFASRFPKRVNDTGFPNIFLIKGNLLRCFTNYYRIHQPQFIIYSINLCIKKDILAALTYFNMFDYPLKKRELFLFMGSKSSRDEFDQGLEHLIEEAAVFKIGNFYSLFNSPSLAERRSRGNDKAAILLKKAARGAGIIARFPFVKGVAVSGSLSKQFAAEDADIDFFIITAANRLWIARTLLHIFKKITFLFNLQDLFCMNYFIDEAEPGILERNIYTATEVATLMPLRGTSVFETFYRVNSWTKKYFPNKYMYLPAAREIKKTWIGYVVEKIFDNRLGNALDSFLMKMTARSWDAKTRKKRRNSKGILMSMHTGKHFSKPNPANFQKKLLGRYEKSLVEVFDQYEQLAREKKDLYNKNRRF